MAIQVEMPDEIGGGGNYLNHPGRYHFDVADTDESPSKKNGEPIDGFKIVAHVLHGDEKGKAFDFIFRNPMPTWSEGGIEQGKRKIGACMVALGFATPENMGKGLKVELSEANNRQFFAEVGYEKDEDGNDKVDDKGRKFLQLVWSNIYHVDDPAAKDFSRDEESLKLLPKEHRISDPTFFDRIRGKKPGANGNGGSNGSAGKPADKPKNPPKSPPATSTTSNVSSDVDDLFK